MQTSSDTHPPTDAELQEAFQAGREDERRRAPQRAATNDRDGAKGWRDAYDRGRRDERARRPGFSLVSLAILVAAVVGGGIIYLAVSQGSFSRGGALVDEKISAAGAQAQAPIRAAADKAGDALQNAGQTLKSNAGDAPAPAATPAPATPPAATPAQ